MAGTMEQIMTRLSLNRLSDRSLRIIGYTLCGFVVAATVVAVVDSIQQGESQRLVDNIVLPFVFLAVIVVLMRTVPRHGVVWSLLGFAFFGVLGERALVRGLGCGY